MNRGPGRGARSIPRRRTRDGVFRQIGARAFDARVGGKVRGDWNIHGLAALFEALRPPMPPIVVVQHMSPSFTKPLAWRLDSR